MSQKPLDERRLWRTEDYGYDTPCWTWVRFVYGSGYGQYRIKGTTWLAHRYFYTRCVGPIPDGHQVDHLCLNKRCVNPDHLEAVTPAENSRRSPHTKLTTTDVLAIRDPANASVTSREFARRLGVDESTVSNVRLGVTWHGVGKVAPRPTERSCGHCAKDISGTDIRRKFCSSRCKSRAVEARRPERVRVR